AAILVRRGRAAGGPRWEAALVLGLIGFFLPVAPGVCAPGNIPYPAWFADVLGLSAILLLAREHAPMWAIGCLWGLVFAFKQNNGVLGVGASAVTIVLIDASAEQGRRWPAVVMAAALVGGSLLLLREYLDTLVVLVFVVPLLPLALAVARVRVGTSTFRALRRLSAWFALVAGAVVVSTIAQAGVSPVRIDFLQIGGDTIRTYYAAHPTPAGVLREVDGTSLLRAARQLADASWFVLFPASHLAGSALVAVGRVRSRVGVAL